MASRKRAAVPEGARPPLLPGLGVPAGFRPEYLDFRKGIRVGNLEEHERITRILKLALESRYRQPFVTERWGRGVYWQWIGFLPRANREAKPVSSDVSFGCSKFFLTVDTAEKLFKCGLQIERGFAKPPPEFSHSQLRPDWDWNRLLEALRPGSPLERELERLVLREGFQAFAGAFVEDPCYVSRANYSGAAALKRLLRAAPGDGWAGFQVFYAMTEKEVRSTTGLDLVESMLAVFREVTPAMNLCMQIELAEKGA